MVAREKSYRAGMPNLLPARAVLAIALCLAGTACVQVPTVTLHHAGYAVAEVVVSGPAGDAGGQAFPILAGYIFGKNKGEKRFAMTAPVTQAAVPVKLEMTAPPSGRTLKRLLPASGAAS